MIDIKVLRENPEYVKLSAKKKQVNVEIDKILQIDNLRRNLLSDYENLRSLQNKASEEIVKLKEEEKKVKITQMKEIAREVKLLQDKIKEKDTELDKYLLTVPNLPREDVPEGKDENENVVVKTWGVPPKFSFEVKDHIELGKIHDLIDVDRAAKVSGARFYYLKNESVLLQFALVQFVFEILNAENFIPIIPPVLAKEEVFYKMGYLPISDLEMYKTTLDNLCLAATSEQTIGAYFSDEILKEEDLPKRFVGFSSCFRREAGSYGKDVRGIFRVHQFDKVEMFIFCSTDQSEKEHQLILSCEEKIMQALNIPYQVVLMCSGDLGFPVAKKYDIEGWFPHQGKYRETHSTSNCTDFQARRLNIRYRDKDNNIRFVHTLNGTACAVGRTLIAILENYQQEDGSITVPQVLVKYLGKSIIEC